MLVLGSAPAGLLSRNVPLPQINPLVELENHEAPVVAVLKSPKLNAPPLVENTTA